MFVTDKFATVVCPVALKAVVLNAFAVTVPGKLRFPDDDRFIAYAPELSTW